MNRREFLVASAAAAWASSSLAQPASLPASRPTTRRAEELTWFDVRDWGVEGRAFDDTENYFDRLPARAKAVVRPEVWRLSRQTAGIASRFESDATEFYVRYELTSPTLNGSNMTPTGASGVDLYTRLPSGWRWAGSFGPKAQDNFGPIVNGLAPGTRAYQLNLPLYNGVESMQIGVVPGSTFTPTRPRRDKPIVWYGTSITQGSAASRPGMCFTHILARRLDRPICNFGFSGNGQTEIEVVRFLAELDASLFVLDTLANTTPPILRERMVACVKHLRDVRPNTPIVVLEDRTWSSADFNPGVARVHANRREQLRLALNDLGEAGVTNVTLIPDAPFLGTDGEATVDGSHPSDLGMMRYADALEPKLRASLPSAG